MNQIGAIIRYLRKKKHLTREQLAEGICTPKYLYLIEKGNRTPSNTILAKLGERMNTSLFEYYSFLECENPIEVKKMMADFILRRRQFDFDWLKQYKDIGETLPDFKKIPWKYEVSFNRSMIKLMVDGKPEEAGTDILKTISEMPPAYQFSVCHLRQLILLSLCYLEAGEEKASNFTIEQVRSVIESKIDCIEFQQLCFVSAYVYMMIKIKTGDPAAAAGIADEVLEQQQEKNFHDLHHFGLLLKGYALIKLGKTEDARSPISRGLLALLVFDKSRDLAYLNQSGLIPDILQSGLIDEKITEAIKNKYQI